MKNKIIKVKKINIGNKLPLTLIAGPCQIESKDHCHMIAAKIQERHRHRYEVNTSYKAMLEKKGVVFSANSPDGKLPEAIELKDHPWFLGVQFHPELKSRPFEPHKIFVSFIEAAIKNKNLNS